MDCSREELLAEMPRLEAELAARPDDPEVRDRYVATLGELTVQMRSLTRDMRPVITTAKQREFCAVAADRMITLGGGGGGGEDVQAGARALKAEIEAGEAWMWQDRTTAAAIAAAVVALGLLVVVLGGLVGSIVAVVAAGVLSSAALAGVVLRHRKQRWQVDADRASAAVWRHGI
jgi:hypothetical protein